MAGNVEATRKAEEQTLHATVMRMLRSAGGVIWIGEIRNEYTGGENRLRWYGHVMRWNGNLMTIEVMNIKGGKNGRCAVY